MIFLKNLFLFAIFLGVSSIGVLMSKKYKNRVKQLKEFKEFFNILESKIKFTYEPLGEIFNQISNISTKNINSILKQTSLNLKKYDFKLAWEKALDTEKQNLSLNDEDICIIKGLGNMLRKDRFAGTNK